MSYAKKDSEGKKYIESKAGKKFYVKDRPKPKQKERGNKYV